MLPRSNVSMGTVVAVVDPDGAGKRAVEALKNPMENKKDNKARRSQEAGDSVALSSIQGGVQSRVRVKFNTGIAENGCHGLFEIVAVDGEG